MGNVKNVILKKKIGGVLYDLLVKTSAGQVEYEDGTVASKLAEALSAIAVLNGSDEGSVAKQIKDATAGLANASDVVSAIVASATSGAITITKGGATSDVTLKGVVTVPTYDADSRTLTMPYVDTDGTSKSVVMALGKDMVVKSGIYDTSSKKIILTLTDGSTVEIPASALVDVYTGETTNSISVSVSSDNKISADVRVSAKTGNTVQVITDEGEEGIYVPTQTFDDTEIQTALANKVDKVTGKGLSTNDYTTEEKTKLAGLSNYDDTALVASVNEKARVIVSDTEPTDLTENDLWAQEITE